MTTELDADDLALLRSGFTAVFEADQDPATTDRALAELGWHELLDSAGRVALPPLFGAAGAAGRLTGALDDVVAHALHQTVDRPCIVHPTAAPVPGRIDGDRLVVDGVVTARIDGADTALVAATGHDGVSLHAVETDALTVAAAPLDPGAALRRVTGDVALPDGSPFVAWHDGIAAARVALAAHLLDGARWMLDAAVSHALGREQFGRPIASFQAVRHKLAETLVGIEGATAVFEAAVATDDDLGPPLAKSLAGAASANATRHAQQVLAGIGFTTDHPFQARMKLAMTVDALYGSARALPTEIGHALAARGGAPRLVEL